MQFAWECPILLQAPYMERGHSEFPNLVFSPRSTFFHPIAFQLIGVINSGEVERLVSLNPLIVKSNPVVSKYQPIS